MIKAEVWSIIKLRWQRNWETSNEEKHNKGLPAYLCIFSPKTLDPAVHAYNLYNNRSKNQAQPLFLWDPAKQLYQN